jgi:hypothetical protein
MGASAASQSLIARSMLPACTSLRTCAISSLLFTRNFDEQEDHALGDGREHDDGDEDVDEERPTELLVETREAPTPPLVAPFCWASKSNCTSADCIVLRSFFVESSPRRRARRRYQSSDLAERREPTRSALRTG